MFGTPAHFGLNAWVVTRWQQKDIALVQSTRKTCGTHTTCEGLVPKLNLQVLHLPVRLNLMLGHLNHKASYRPHGVRIMMSPGKLAITTIMKHRNRSGIRPLLRFSGAWMLRHGGSLPMPLSQNLVEDLISQLCHCRRSCQRLHQLFRTPWLLPHMLPQRASGAQAFSTP